MPFVPDQPNKPSPGFVPDTPTPTAANPQQELVGLARNPMPQDPWIKEAAMNAGAAGEGGAASGGEAVSKLASLLGKGASKAGDFLMQRAVGLKNYIPGLGETLANQGVIGTKGMMRSQVSQGMETTGKQINKLARDIPAVSTQPIAEQLGNEAAKLVGPNGEVLPDNISAFHKYADEAREASTEDYLPGDVAASRRAQYGKIANQAGAYRDNPAQGFKAKMAGNQQAGYSQALKEAGGEPMIAADKAYSALATANKPLNAPADLSMPALAQKSIPVIVGGATGGLPGAALGAALDTPLAQSAIGRGLIGTGKAAQSKTLQSLLRAAPATQEELLKDRE